MPPKKESRNIDVAKGFEELEGIAAWFERGDGDLDEGLKKFERAMSLAAGLKDRLDAAENAVREIRKRFDVANEE